MFYIDKTNIADNTPIFDVIEDFTSDTNDQDYINIPAEIIPKLIVVPKHIDDELSPIDREYRLSNITFLIRCPCGRPVAICNDLNQKKHSDKIHFVASSEYLTKYGFRMFYSMPKTLTFPSRPESPLDTKSCIENDWVDIILYVTNLDYVSQARAQIDAMENHSGNII